MPERDKAREVKATLVRDMRKAGFTSEAAERKAAECMREVDRGKRKRGEW